MKPGGGRYCVVPAKIQDPIFYRRFSPHSTPSSTTMSEGEAKTSTPTEVFELLCDQKSGVRWMMMELGSKSKSLILVSAPFEIFLILYAKCSHSLA